MHSLQDDEIVIDCTHDGTNIAKLLPFQVFIKSINIQADFKVDHDELLYLIDIVPMTFVTVQDLEKTVFYLRKKESFAKIALVYHPNTQSLECRLEGLSTLSYIHIHGSMIGKEKYKNCYVIDIGEHFDQKKHDYSIKKMKEKLYHEGSFHAKVVDKISYDPVLKTVKVDLFISKGKQFTIGNCTFDFPEHQQISKEDLLKVQQKIKKLFVQNIFVVKYSKHAVDACIKKLEQYLTESGFSQVVIKHDEHIDYQHYQVDMVFHISFDQKKEVIFLGNHFFKREDFLENILMYGTSSLHFPQEIVSDEIESMYTSKGFWDVKITVKQEPAKLYCIIEEGPRAMVGKIKIKDNFNLADAYVQKECFAQLVGKPFDRDLFNQAIKRLKLLYAQQGFWDVIIAKEEFVKFAAEQKTGQYVEYAIVITVDEGDLKKLKAITIPGHQEILQQGPFAQCNFDSGAVPFNRIWLQQQKNWLLDYFKQAGFGKVLVTDNLQESTDGFNLEWNIDFEKKRPTFGKFIVTGNSQIPFKYLQRELSIEQGQVWDKKKIDSSLQNLRNLELFETAHIYAHKQMDDQSDIPVGIKLLAADTYEMRARIGCQQVGKDFALQQGFSYKVGGTAIVNNPFKFGDRAIVEADFTRFYENFSVQYLMPWLFTRPIRSQIKLYDNHYLQPLFIGSDVSIYNAFQQGILFGLQEKHEHINIGISIGIECKGIRQANIKDIAHSIDYDAVLFAKKFAYFFAQPSFMWTNVDNIVNPCRGSNALISLLAMADLEQQTSLFKFLGEYGVYIPCTARTICAIRTRIGHIFNKKYTEILPIDRFYLGGANTIRGYDRDYCPPLGKLTKPVYAPHVGLPVAADDLWWYVPQGGRTMFNCNFEVRFPLYGQLQGATFLDTGVLIKDTVADLPDNFLGGVGFGFRYTTPIGPIRFDIACKLDRKYKQFESLYVWYLTLGQAF